MQPEDRIDFYRLSILRKREKNAAGIVLFLPVADCFRSYNYKCAVFHANVCSTAVLKGRLVCTVLYCVFFTTNLKWKCMLFPFVIHVCLAIHLIYRRKNLDRKLPTHVLQRSSLDIKIMTTAAVVAAISNRQEESLESASVET